ncbi:ABC transporter substrate-binding protein [Caldilinea sp.]|uniref:ABC transporter substrate-binding protein n=1 Tax=Caldilinea sp. TaxID=2293560 RepID=UPI002B6F70B4|nr:ABC transporter substrate-binding protein [Caldilinea sp.]
MRKRISIVLAISVVTMLLLAACGGAPAAPAPQAEQAAPAAAQPASTGGKFNEAPMLAEKVAAGELPPVDERLPAAPLVIEPVEEVGQYGGTWRMVDSQNDNGWLRQTIWVEPLLKWNRDMSGMRPNLLESFTWNDDATVLTVKFREGIKWSDGEPLTVDDFLFWWNDIILDPAAGQSPPTGAAVGDEPMKVEKVDDATLTLTFAAPNPLFLDYASRGSYSSSMWVVPAHYLKQFHPKYNSEVTDMTELLNRYNSTSRMQYADMPTFAAWMVTDYVPGERVSLERNPYYWKVDTAGNQLPYIDKLEVQIPQGSAIELVMLKALAGELDMQTRDVDLKDVPLVMENADAGDYHVIMWNRGDYAWPWLIPMYDYTDEGIVDLMYTKEFRRALSYAINREQQNEVAHLGLGKPRQFALSAESPEFQSEEGKKVYEEWAQSYAAYDPEQAKTLLDGLGLKDVDGDGLRERADGTPLELIVDVPSDGDKLTIDAMDMIQQQWEAVGLKTTLNMAPWSVIDQRAAAGEIMIRAWGSAAAWGLISAPTVWTPIEGVTYSVGGQRIGQYYQSLGAAGVAPRAGSMLEKLQDAYTDLISTVDPAERDQKLLDAYRIHIDEGPITIGTVGEHPSPVIVKNNVHNVPETGIVASWDLGFPGTADPEQFFFR